MRAWDHFDAYLFDIDGTLLHCTDAVHYFGFCTALSEFAGRPMNLDGVVTHGNVDPAILRDALLRAQLDESAWRPKLPQMCETICHYVEQHADDFRIEVLPGVRDTLAYLAARGALVSLATGNLERVGWAKLKACGLASYFTCGGFSNARETRSAVFAAAAAAAKQQLAKPTAALCVLGDTPADIEAAQANGLAVIAVATGIYSHAELAAAHPDLLVSSLAELKRSPTS